MTPQFPLSRDLVLIGGGHAHALVLRQWGMNPLAGARVTVINPGPTAPYSGMLPGFVAGHYDRDDLDIDLVRLARFAGARLINGAVGAIDPVSRQITVRGRPPIAYDVASIDIGITSQMPELPGFADHGVPAKPLGAFASAWEAFRATASDPQVAVIGGGVAGAELALAMRHALNSDGHSPVIHLIDRARVGAALGSKAQAKVRAALAEQNVTLCEGVEISEVSASGVTLNDGTNIAAQFVTGAAGAKPHDWVANIGVTTEAGFISVNEQLQSSEPTLFAVGDCAHMRATPRPKAGVYAVRQAPVLFDNLRAALSGGQMRAYVPQRDYLKLISLGGKSALAERFGLTVAGPMLWRWKDHIDQTFMQRLNDLPVMELPDLPRDHATGMKEALGPKPMCGGCGAKVGRNALQRALVEMPPTDRSDVQHLPGDDAAVLTTGGTQQVLTTDHLRSFWSDPVVMTRIAAAHALGDIWAMGASPQAATVNLILPAMSAEMQERTLSEIMWAAHQTLTNAGAAIVGGHTSLGAELTVGFSLTGLAKRPAITLAGARAGDALILTKPLGSGTIMAGEMAGKARGADVIAALGQMMQGQGAASGLLARAHAMTDVTGFGLAGHLTGLCAASGVGARLNLEGIAMMQGAVALAQNGVRSSLFEDNRQGAPGVQGDGSARFDLLFDPQTAGGLLAAVPADDAAALIYALRSAGYADAAVIGAITDDPGQIVVSRQSA